MMCVLCKCVLCKWYNEIGGGGAHSYGFSHSRTSHIGTNHFVHYREVGDLIIIRLKLHVLACPLLSYFQFHA